MTRPTILDLDLVVVPREATDEMLEPTGDSYSLSTLWDAMLSASPYPTAWDDVRKAYDGLEKECERLKFLVEWGEAFCDTKHPDTTRAEAAEARIAELEAALDENEVADGLTSNGNLWRFWSTKASALAVRNAELEKRLADAERVIEPFAKVKTADGYPDGFLRIPDEHGMLFNATDALGETTNWEPVVLIGHLRAARAYMEGK